MRYRYSDLPLAERMFPRIQAEPSSPPLLVFAHVSGHAKAATCRALHGSCRAPLRAHARGGSASTLSAMAARLREPHTPEIVCRGAGATGPVREILWHRCRRRAQASSSSASRPAASIAPLRSGFALRSLAQWYDIGGRRKALSLCIDVK